ncbi:MAG: hypothetical protein IPO88_03310 [Nannocystis sp.]|uniref:hypothetical protein n=1 Tax=Nannocystis sp. TaxID=1962667 RepID=UPI0024253686|nr:hypothetical protein [Nannocystis sp.]MBK9752530.1 hypothetical protein [Nannocystis sp.]
MTIVLNMQKTCLHYKGGGDAEGAAGDVARGRLRPLRVACPRAPVPGYPGPVQGSALAFLFLAYVAALAVSTWRGVPPGTLVTWGAGGAALIWLVVLVTLPWNLHFRAREVLGEMRRSIDAGITVTADQLAFAEKVKRWTLATSLGIHILSAAVALALALFTGNQLGYPFAGFYLLSSLVRPATASIQQVRRRLEHIAEDTRFPRDDVMKLRAQVEAHELAVKELRETLEALRSEHDAALARADKQRGDLDLKIAALARKFEESLDRLTDNRELISGIKAFLRMVRDPAPLPIE